MRHTHRDRPNATAPDVCSHAVPKASAWCPARALIILVEMDARPVKHMYLGGGRKTMGTKRKKLSIFVQGFKAQEKKEQSDSEHKARFRAGDRLLIPCGVSASCVCPSTNRNATPTKPP